VTALQKGIILRTVCLLSNMDESTGDMDEVLNSVFDPAVGLPVAALVLYVTAVAQSLKGKPKTALEW
jgi:hypothetical protein